MRENIPDFVSAISAAVQALTGLVALRNRNEVSDAANAYINELEINLRSLRGVGTYLQEAKAIHDHLNRIMPNVAKMHEVYINALHHGKFVKRDYDIDKIIFFWDGNYRFNIEFRCLLLEVTAYEENSVTWSADSGYNGPDWLKVCLNEIDQLNYYLTRTIDGEDIDESKIATSVNILNGNLINALSHTNHVIRDSAIRIVSGFNEFGNIQNE